MTRREFWEVARDVVHDTPGVQPKAIAIETGIPLQRLYEATLQDERQRRPFRPEWIIPVTRATGNDAMLAHLAQAVGGVFYRLHRSGPIDEHTSRALKEFGDFLHSVAAADADRQYTADEARECEREGLEAVAAILAHIDYVRTRAGLPPRGEESPTR